MNDKYLELSNKYNNFNYNGYDIEYDQDNIKVIYHFEIEGLCSFNPSFSINCSLDNKNKSFIENIIFNIGLVEVISYWKSVCSKNINIKCGYLSDEQIKWFKKLYFNGLGEFFYRNNIEVSFDNFVNINCLCDKKFDLDLDYVGNGNLIPVGGGKDSNVTLELLKDEDNTCFVINPKDVHYECIDKSNVDNTLIVNRKIDKKLIELNELGYLNGHTPFSALVSFISLLGAYLLNKKYIVLSNEGSANEATVIGSDINHQYSKSYDYENDFNYYVNKYFKIDIKYFSLLRCLNELQIAMLFSNYKKYHHIFRSCNLGSKDNNWKWCGECPKCLFTFIILAAFMDYEEVVDIFNKDLLDDEDLLKDLKELLGETASKPFECVGTIDEVKTAMSLIVKRNNRDSLLIKYFKDNYDLLNCDLLKEFNNENNIDPYFINIVKEEIEKYV